MKHWAVIGGGVLGMTLAMRLAQRGCRVTLLERADHLGGLADVWTLGDVVWDRHYHVILMSDHYLRSLLEELDLDRSLNWVETKTGFFVGGSLYSMSNSWEFLRFPPLGLIDKLRLGGTIFYASRIRDGSRLDAVPVGDWLRRWSGRRTFETIWLPLLKAKLGENHHQASAVLIWATIARMYSARRTGLKKEMFGHAPGGWGALLKHFSRRLDELGIEIKTAHAVQSIDRRDGSFRVEIDGREAVRCDRVVVTAPAPVAARMCAGLQEKEKARLQDVNYQGIVCASLLLKKPLSPYYVTNITDPAPFSAIIEMTALVDPTVFGGRSLIYLPRYAPAEDPLFETSDEKIRESFLAGLQRMHPSFSLDDLEAFRISRVRRVMAVPTVGYRRRAPPQTTSIPGLFLVNSAQILDGTLNVNETIRLAETALPTLLSDSLTNADELQSDELLSPAPAVR